MLAKKGADWPAGPDKCRRWLNQGGKQNRTVRCALKHIELQKAAASLGASKGEMLDSPLSEMMSLWPFYKYSK